MKLDEYIWKNRISRKDFSKKSGITAAALHKLIHRKCTPSLVNALKIVKITKGDVSFEDLII